MLSFTRVVQDGAGATLPVTVFSGRSAQNTHGGLHPHTRREQPGSTGRPSPLLKLQGDAALVAMIRAGHDHAFEVLFERYHSRLLAFCRHMLRSTEDAEDVLQEVFVKAHAAMRADERPINVRPWLYRIARNRCLNHLRRPVPDGQDSMDVIVGEGGVTTADRVQKREDFRALVADVQDLPETQRTALLLRELDALSYDEIARDHGHDGARGEVAAGASADVARRGDPLAPAHLRRGPARARRGGRGTAQGDGPGAPSHQAL